MSWKMTGWMMGLLRLTQMTSSIDIYLVKMEHSNFIVPHHKNSYFLQLRPYFIALSQPLNP